MVETAARGKGVEHLFSKYVGIPRVLGGKDYVVFCGSDSKFSGEGSFRMCSLWNEMVLVAQSM